VPFTVVADWIQQGRLLEDDMVKASGTKEWFRIGGSAEFSPYLPRSLPQRVDDKAEALEPVEVGFSWKRPKEDDDEEVDMIPLIDVTLVLLIFFMLSAVPAASAMIDLPSVPIGGSIETDYKVAGIAIDIIGKGAAKEMRFTLSSDNAPLTDEKGNVIQFQSAVEAMERLKVLLSTNKEPVNVTINAHKDVRASVLLQVTKALEQEKREHHTIVDIKRGVATFQ
jgi:biopolymer transport protein ExbD